MSLPAPPPPGRPCLPAASGTPEDAAASFASLPPELAARLEPVIALSKEHDASVTACHKRTDEIISL